MRAVVVVAVFAAAPALAHAQMRFNQATRQPETAAPRQPPPPALPGAASGGGAAPATRLATDMEPNDALFDAINRGDLAAARDAIGRGAELNARNVLGMTPIELSIDLARNDISFMLLSMARSDDGRPTQARAAAKPPATKPAPARQPVKAATPVPKPPAAQTARLFSGDGGTPNPNVGFLGFDSGRR